MSCLLFLVFSIFSVIILYCSDFMSISILLLLAFSSALTNFSSVFILENCITLTITTPILNVNLASTWWKCIYVISKSFSQYAKLTIEKIIGIIQACLHCLLLSVFTTGTMYFFHNMYIKGKHIADIIILKTAVSK